MLPDEERCVLELLLADLTPSLKSGGLPVYDSTALAVILLALRAGVLRQYLLKGMGCGADFKCQRRLRI